MKRRNFLATATAAVGLPLLAKEKSDAKPQPVNMNTPATTHFDAIVLGVGSMGSATVWQLAQRGHRVLGIEQFDISHDQGSHAGQSRIIRQSYFEHPDYVPLLQRSYSNLAAFEKETGAKIFHKAGVLYFGKRGNELTAGVEKSANIYKLTIQKPGHQEAAKQFPSFAIPADFDIIFEPDAGFMTPERTILTYTEEAIRLGATVQTKESVQSWKQEGNQIRVITDKGEYTADKLIITAGGWAPYMIPQLKQELTVTKQMIMWVNPKSWKPFAYGNFPCWIMEDPDRGSYYGFPIVPTKEFGGPLGLKLAHHQHGEVTDAKNVNRAVTPGTEEDLTSILRKYIPEAVGSILSIKSCLYTNSKDQNFIIDHLPGSDKRVTIATGFSGHGFKFVPVVGEILADLAMKGKTELPIGFLGMNRIK
ncbi:MAG TPA: N-methyl-L-tryptophan oxidase [Cyclobacteriaceae bacterium]|nr:N-methyl-L-tryptophan oxidase [Cyclobacteriaceae bacterium]